MRMKKIGKREKKEIKKSKKYEDEKKSMKV